jgi:CO/xanthine dehydrogenase FAD-binding subunit
MGLRTAFVCSIISVATWVKVRDGVFEKVRIAMGAVAPTPIRLPAAEGSLTGKAANADTIAACALLASEEIKPITDLRASAKYRKDLANTLTKRALAACLADLGNRP